MFRIRNQPTTVVVEVRSATGGENDGKILPSGTM